MKNKLLISALGLALSQSGFAQDQVGGIAVPDGYKPVSIAISGNGQKAMVCLQGETDTKYVSYQKSQGQFQAASDDNPLNSLIGKNIIPMNPSLSVDGSEIYYAADNGSGNTDIYMLKKVNGKWQDAVALGDSINSAANEQYPAISPDGNSLYFVRLNPDAIDKRGGTIFRSLRRPGTPWSQAKDLPEPVTLGCDAYVSVAPDGKSLYLSSVREQGLGGFDVYFTQSPYNDNWLIPPVVDSVSLAADELSPCWDYESKKLYYIQQDPKKKSKYNIVSKSIAGNFQPMEVSRYSGRTLDLVSGKPIGADITVTDVFSSLQLCTFKSDGVTGEYDFFLNKRDNDVFLDFSAPMYSHAIEQVRPNGGEVNKDRTIFKKVALQLNVFDSEMFEALSSSIKLSQDGKSSSIVPAEFSKGRYKMELPIGYNYDFSITKDLYEDYKFNLDLSQVVIFDSFERDAELKSMKAPLKVIVKGLDPNASADVTIVDESTENKYTDVITTDANGECGKYLRKGDKYTITIMKKGYTMYNTNLDVALDCPASGYVVVAELVKLQENVRIEIPNVNFETASAVLQPSSYETLNKVVSLLKLNPGIKVELSAHTDDRGADGYNMKLSDQRAASVAGYILNKGVDKSMLVSKGYGKTMPLVPNTTDENRAKNRRVEIKILGTVTNQ